MMTSIERMFGLQDVLQDVFEHAVFGPAALLKGSAPSVNLYEGKDELVATAELPGVRKEDLAVKVLGDTLTIEGERKAPAAAEKDVERSRERAFGRFSRSFTLPCAVNEDKIEAEYTNGVLTVRLPKAPQVKPRQIEIR